MNLAGLAEKALPHIRKSAEPADQVAYSRDLWPRHHIAVRDGRVAEHRPGLVVWPETTADVAAIVRFCASEGVPLVPFGAGSGVCGGVLPDPRTVILDMKRMAKWRALDRSTLSLEVEAGALGIRLEEDLQAQALTLGHFPSSILCSTVGGWIAARSAGQCSGRYGKIEDMVAAVECVTGTGDVVTFQRRAHGPDVCPLIVGSEGVLAIATAAKLRLHPAPPTRAFGSLTFPTLEAGWSAMRAMFQVGLRPAVARLYDPFDSFIARRGARRAEHHAPSGMPDLPTDRPPHAEPPPRTAPRPTPGAGAIALRSILRVPSALNNLVNMVGSRAFGGAMLVLIFEGPSGETSDDLAHAVALGKGYGGKPLGEGPARHWMERRYSVSYRQAPMFMSGAFVDTMEVAAPWSKLGALYENVRAALGRHVFVMAHLSHAYPDGCSIYFTFAGGGKNAAHQEAAYDAAWRSALEAALASGGTISHHHGVGRSKAPALGAELGLGTDVVHALRRTFDPAGILNPGNLLPREGTAPRPTFSPAKTIEIDSESLLVLAPGGSTLAEVNAAVGREGFAVCGTSGALPLDMTVTAWIASGMNGGLDVWLDPVDHAVAGFTAQLSSGAPLLVRPAPRRAVGPDLFALFHGTGDKVGSVTSAWLRLERATPVGRGASSGPPSTASGGPPSMAGVPADRPSRSGVSAVASPSSTRGALPTRAPTYPRPLPTNLDRDPPVSQPESEWIDRILTSAAAVTGTKAAAKGA